MSQRLFVDMPDRIAHLPRDERDFPVPRFVATIDGKPDFRVIKPGWMGECVNHNKCWVCGGHLGKNKAFVIGPMCAINRINSEPPCHYECARFAARNCPFLTKPNMRRNEKDLPEDRVEAPGMPIARNPGCVAVWVTYSYEAFKPRGGGVLFGLGPPARLEFWREAREATRAEVEESVSTGLPILEAAANHDGPQAIEALRQQVSLFGSVLDFAYPAGAGA